MSALEGRVALVTGAARGIGAAVCERLRVEGMVVVATDVAAGADGVVACDVADPVAVAERVAAVEAEHGGLDVVVANAGVAAPYARLVDLPDTAIDRVLDVNVRGVLHTARATLPALRRRGGGRLVLMASQLGKDAWAGWAVYSASKAFVVSLAQSLAVEHGADGILVNAVCPGSVDTPMLRQAFADRAAREGGEADALLAGYVRERIPVGRVGSPEDVAAAVAWLAGDDAAFTTGTALNVTGGEQRF